MIIILFILASTLALAFEHPLEDPNSEKMHILKEMDLAFTIFFTVEALIKIITFGFFLNGT